MYIGIFDTQRLIKCLLEKNRWFNENKAKDSCLFCVLANHEYPKKRTESTFNQPWNSETDHVAASLQRTRNKSS